MVVVDMVCGRYGLFLLQAMVYIFTCMLNLPQHIHRGCFTSSQQVHYMCHRCQRLAECELALAESVEDSADVAQLNSAD